MKIKQEVPRKFALTVIALMAIAILIILCQPRANAQVRPRKMETGKMYHDRLQKQNSWENYQANRLKSAKARAKAKKQQEADRKKEVRLQARIRRIEG